MHDALLFPFPPSLDVRDPDEAKTVRRLIDALRQMRHEGLIDSAAFDEQETIPEPTISALAETGCSASRSLRSTAGRGCRPPAMRASSARCRGSTRRSPC